MNDRITRKNLQALVDRLNKEMGRPATPWTRTGDGRIVANVGNFHLSGAYGGWCIHEMANACGGVRTPILAYHAPARELWDRTHAFLAGLACRNR